MEIAAFFLSETYSGQSLSSSYLCGQRHRSTERRWYVIEACGAMDQQRLEKIGTKIPSLTCKLATITYEDPYTTDAAIKWFDGKDFHGHVRTISLCPVWTLAIEFEGNLLTCVCNLSR